jgi:putative flippase GtrA
MTEPLFQLLRFGSSTGYLNRRFTFKVTPERPIGREQLRYLLAMSSIGIVNYVVSCLVVGALTVRNYVAAIGVASGSIRGLAIDFALAKWWVFRPTYRWGTT